MELAEKIRQKGKVALVSGVLALGSIEMGGCALVRAFDDISYMALGPPHPCRTNHYTGIRSRSYVVDLGSCHDYNKYLTHRFGIGEEIPWDISEASVLRDFHRSIDGLKEKWAVEEKSLARERWLKQMEMVR